MIANTEHKHTFRLEVFRAVDHYPPFDTGKKHNTILAGHVANLATVERLIHLGIIAAVAGALCLLAAFVVGNTKLFSV